MRSLELQHFNRFYFFYDIESIYGKILSMIKKDSNFSIEDMEIIKEIDRQAYPPYLRLLEGAESLKDLIDYCRCANIAQIEGMIKNDWYILVAKHYNCVELISCASKTGKCSDIFTIVDFLITRYKRKVIYADCRESTSYRLFKIYEKSGKIKILNDWINVENGETLHFIKIKVQRKKRK